MQTGGFQNVYIISKKRPAHGRIDPFRHEYSGFGGHLYGQSGGRRCRCADSASQLHRLQLRRTGESNRNQRTGTFNEQGAEFFSSYRFPGLADVLANAGINTNYKLYAAFVADGTVAPTAVEGRLLMIG